MVLNIKSANGRRSFSFAAPMIWNSLPEHIRNSCSLTFFRKQLKSLCCTVIVRFNYGLQLKLLVQLMTDSLDFCLD